VRDGDRVYRLDGSGQHWEYRDLAAMARATNGMDYDGHRVRAWIDGDQLVVQHGDNPEAVRAFTADELNMIGGDWDDGDVVMRWCEEIDRQGAR
jgi:hypothetical protein